MKVMQVVDEFYNGREARVGNLKSERRGDNLYLVHFDTDIAYIENERVNINSVKYSRTTSKFTWHLRDLCIEGLDDYDDYEGTPSDRVHYYEMGERR